MTFGILGNTEKPGVRNIAGGLISYLEKNKLPYLVHEGLATLLTGNRKNPVVQPSLQVPDKDLVTRSGMIISLGGDGTMLATARLVGSAGIPILGVNLGKLGFRAEVSVDELFDWLDDISRGKYFIDERMTLEASSSAEPDRMFTALNDIVIDRGSYPRVIDLETSVNDDYLVTYSADGIILATPTGSTAYSLASGGPIAEPHSSVMIITPISPHTLSARPVIVGADSIVRVSVRSPGVPVHLTGDGQYDVFYPAPVDFTIRRGKYRIKLVKREGRKYFDLLRAKLMWGRDIRMEKGST